MGFFDKYKIEDVPIVRQRKDTKDVLVDMIKLQLKIAKNGPQVAKTVIKDGVSTVRYVSSWYNQKTGYVVPKVASLSLIPDDKASGGGKGVPLPEGRYEEFLTSMLDAFKNDDPEAVAVTSAFDKQRAARDERLNKSRKDGKKK